MAQYDEDPNLEADVQAAIAQNQRLTGGAISNLKARARQLASEAGVDPDLVEAVISLESNWNPEAVSNENAQGLMQLLPSTAAELGVTDTFDPEQNLRGGIEYLKRQLNRFGGDVPTALTAYHSGPGNVINNTLGPRGLEYPGLVLARLGKAPSEIGVDAGPITTAQSDQEAAQSLVDTLFADFGVTESNLNKPDDKSLEELVTGLPDPQDSLVSWGDTISDILIDQLDPLNLGLLIASLPVGGLTSKAATKFLGPSVTAFGYKVLPNALTKAGAVTGETIIPHAAGGAAVSALFSAAELVEEPPEGATRLGQFARAFVFNEVIDAGLLAFKIPFRMMRRSRGYAHQTFQHAMRNGATPDQAAADAIIGKLELLKADGVPAELIDQITTAATKGISENTGDLIKRLTTEFGPTVAANAARRGLSPGMVARGFQELQERLFADAVGIRMAKAPRQLPGVSLANIMDRGPRLHANDLPDYLIADPKGAQLMSDAYQTILTHDHRYPMPAPVARAISNLENLGMDGKELKRIRLEVVANARRPGPPIGPTAFTGAARRIGPPAFAEGGAARLRGGPPMVIGEGADVSPTKAMFDSLETILVKGRLLRGGKGKFAKGVPWVEGERAVKRELPWLKTEEP